MKLVEITSQHRNDFSGILKCNHCDSYQKLTTGYDDAYYHNVVIPKIHCNSCGMDNAGKFKVKETS